MRSIAPSIHKRPGAPTAERLRQVLAYDPEKGLLTHLRPSRGPLVQGAVAGTTDNYGYRNIGVDGVRYKAHQLAWLHYYGEWADSEIDHVNRDPADNRISNLRKCNRQQNQRNRDVQRNNLCGIKGVQKLPGGSYRARIYIAGKYVQLGCYRSLQAAKAARVRGESIFFGSFAQRELAA